MMAKAIRFGTIGTQRSQNVLSKRGPKDTVQLLQRYPEDVALMKEIGFNSFRTSIQWSRLLPEGRGAVNQQAVAFYREYFATLIENGIEPFINLYHFDMPMALQKKAAGSIARLSQHLQIMLLCVLSCSVIKSVIGSRKMNRSCQWRWGICINSITQQKSTWHMRCKSATMKHSPAP